MYLIAQCSKMSPLGQGILCDDVTMQGAVPGIPYHEFRAAPGENPQQKVGTFFRESTRDFVDEYHYCGCA